MTDGELRAEAQRLVESYAFMDAIIPRSLALPSDQDGPMEMGVRFARLWIAEHDETPFDFAWLERIGFLPDDCGTGDLFIHMWLPGESEDLEVIKGREHTHMYLCKDGSYGFEAYDDQGKSLAIVMGGQIKTRGEVLRLCTSLNITLKEPTNGEDKTGRI